MNEASPNGTMSDPKKCPQCGATLPTGALDGLCPACLLQQGATKDSATQPAMPPFEPPPLDELARLFPHLDVLELIGKGGMGAVYKARQPSLDRFVALKILPPETVAGHGFGERFNREARALARLGHPNIVAVYDFGQAGGLHYFLMEFVDGVNLRQLQRAGRLSPREALQIIPQICDALQYAHDEGVVHRDIKPENILVDRKGRVKIADFGLAKILGRDPADLRLTGEGQVMGTPHYMAPEQIEHPLDVDHRADIYSLGVVFYEMLTGELPIGRFAPPSRKVHVDVRLDEVVLHALEKEPEQRYQHASQVKSDVQTIAAGTPGTLLAKAASSGEPAASALDAARRQVKGPAIGLLATGVLNWLLIPLALWVLTYFAANAALGQPPLSKPAFILLALTPLVLCSFIVFAALKMMRLEARSAAVAASILAIVITPGNVIGLPLGIWALVVLMRSEVRAAFEQTSQRRGHSSWWRSRAFRTASAGAVLFALAALGVRLFVLIPFEVTTDAVNREIPRGSHVLLFKLARHFAANDIVVYRANGMRLVGRVTEAGPRDGKVQIARGNDSAEDISARDIVGRVVVNTRTGSATASSSTAETWSPPPALGEKPDPYRIRDEAKSLAAQGRYEEALQRQIWFHNHALEYAPSLNGVRLSYALDDWADLGRKYPKARQALVEIRDRKTRAFAGRGGSFALFHDVTRINDHLEDEDATYTLFKTIQTNNPALAERCFIVAEEVLVKKGEYALCLSYIRNPEAKFARIREEWESQQAWARRDPIRNHPLIRKNTEDEFVVETSRLIEILVGMGHKAEAEKIREQALLLLDDPRLKSAVSDAEKKVNQ